MADNVNNKPANRWETERGDEVDRALDATLATYAAIEPRAGLDERILARLQSEPKSQPRPVRWHWSAAAVLATVIITISLVGRRSRPTQPAIATRPSIQNPEELNRLTSSSIRNRVARNAASPTERVVIRHLHPSVVAAGPKLDQFPSPQPLTKEELALARYVRSFPKEATLVAQAQEEFDLETQKAMDDARPESRPSSSIHEER
jgi:hypothetical protein